MIMSSIAPPPPPMDTDKHRETERTEETKKHKQTSRETKVKIQVTDRRAEARAGGERLALFWARRSRLSPPHRQHSLHTPGLPPLAAKPRSGCRLLLPLSLAPASSFISFIQVDPLSCPSVLVFTSISYAYFLLDAEMQVQQETKVTTL